MQQNLNPFPVVEMACEACLSKHTEQVINAYDKYRAGWLCIDCGHFTTATPENRELQREGDRHGKL